MYKKMEMPSVVYAGIQWPKTVISRHGAETKQSQQKET
jgi:hypothetical protein